MAAAPAAPPAPKTETVTRVTKEGRKLTYCLTVIQQPERARACGSGAKSSADRRPVDPPPVVELRIFEGEGQEKEDVTFSYNANFFLFATLEVARPMAHGRLPQPPSPQVPVLTGMPVSGMAYLDRPTEAGYFIFPDLSVRHEGKYRLSFNLYEETKEGKDADADPSTESKKVLTGPGAPDSSFDWRLEVKSATFTVYSAKKFPGLAESTVLSRTVAEQGCRVRIRRDVRMRRREGKPGGDFEDVGEDDYARPGRASEQAHDQYRERSQSGSPDSVARTPYADPQRRMYGEYQQQYPPYTPSPVSSHAPPPPGGHLSFMDRTGAGPQYAAPPPQFAQPQPPPAPQTYQPAPNASYPPGPPGPPQFRAPQPHAQHGNYSSYDRQYHPQSAYPANPPREQQHFEEYRRASFPPPPTSAPSGIQYPPPDSSYNRAPYHSYAPRSQSPAPATLPPLKMPSIEPKYESLASPSGPLSSVNRIAPPLHSPSYERAPDRSNSYSQHSAAPPLPTLSEVARSGKRSFDSVFNSSASHQPLHNGMRPSSSHHNQGFLDDEEDQIAMEAMKMSYRRADGTSLSRELPTLE